MLTHANSHLQKPFSSFFEFESGEEEDDVIIRDPDLRQKQMIIHARRRQCDLSSSTFKTV